ncbi:MAG: P-II family nitrogen regulator [Zavarzinella sp.]
MNYVIIIVKPFRAEAVLQVLADHQLTDYTVREVKGYSRQKGYLEKYIGSEYSLAFLPKVEITAWVGDELLEILTEKIAGASRTGRIGDGKIFIIPTIQGEAIEF